MATNLIGADASIVVDGKDISRYCRSSTYTALLAAIQNTKFQAPGRFHEFTAGLRGGAVGFVGDLPLDDVDALPELQNTFGSPRTPHVIFLAPAGAQPGNLVRVGKSLQNNFATNDEVEGLISYNGDFEKTAGSPGVSSGVVLFSPYGDDTMEVTPRWRVVATDIDGDRTVTFYNEDGSSAGDVTLETDDDATAVQVKVRALGGDYAAATVS